jgi:hypothetical protein
LLAAPAQLILYRVDLDAPNDLRVPGWNEWREALPDTALRKHGCAWRLGSTEVGRLPNSKKHELEVVPTSTPQSTYPLKSNDVRFVKAISCANDEVVDEAALTIQRIVACRQVHRVAMVSCSLSVTGKDGA